MKSTSTLFCG